MFRLERFAIVHLIMFLIVLIRNNAHDFVPDFWLHSVCKSFFQPTLDGFLRWGHFVETEALECPGERLEGDDVKFEAYVAQNLIILEVSNRPLNYAFLFSYRYKLLALIINVELSWLDADLVF